MSYIIVAEFDPGAEINRPGAKQELLENFAVRVLSERDGVVKVDVSGDHHRVAELVRNLCDCLIKSGIFEFSIHHSY